MSPRRPLSSIGLAFAIVLCAVIALPSVAHQSPSGIDSIWRLLVSPVWWLATIGAVFLFVLGHMRRFPATAPAVLYAAIVPLMSANSPLASLTASATLILGVLLNQRLSRRHKRPRSYYFAIFCLVVVIVGVALPRIANTSSVDPFAVRDALLLLLPALLLGMFGAMTRPGAGRPAKFAGLLLCAVAMLLPFVGIATSTLVLSLPFWVLAAAGVRALRAAMLDRTSARLTRAIAAVAFALTLLLAAPAARAALDGVGRLAYVLLPNGPPPA